jgi:hypothetical protein
VSCKPECPKEPHYHIDDSGPICSGDVEPHPDWCAVSHVTVFSGTIEEAREIGLFGDA